MDGLTAPSAGRETVAGGKVGVDPDARESDAREPGMRESDTLESGTRGSGMGKSGTRETGAL